MNYKIMTTKSLKQEIMIGAPPKDIFDAWMDSKKHGEIIGANANIDPKVDGKFDIWDGYAIGKTLELDPEKLKIVQSWRDNSWPENHFSTITIEFDSIGNNQTSINFSQTDIPEKNFEDIKEGWYDYYWRPMKKYFNQ